MIYLILAILCSSSLAVILRLNQDRISSEPGMFAANYVVCSLLSAVCATGSYGSFISGAGGDQLFLVLFGCFTGIVFAVTFVLDRRCIRVNGVALSTTFMKLGVLIPTLMSVLIFHERPDVFQLAGIGLAVAAIIFLGISERSGSGPRLPEEGAEGSGKRAALLLLLLLGSGFADGSQKVFEELGVAEWKNIFLLCLFLAAVFFCVIRVVIRKEKVTGRDLLTGAILGIPNYCSSLFLLRALERLDAVLVFPVLSGSTILAGILTGVFAFREKLDTGKWLALILIFNALILLNL